MKNLFIGIDFSKLTIDVSFFECENLQKFTHAQFANHSDGFKEIVRWLKKQSSIPAPEWMFCGEYTGLYSVKLSEASASRMNRWFVAG
jgi:hypothetical protein